MLKPYCCASAAKYGTGNHSAHCQNSRAAAPFDWDTHKRNRNMGKAQTVRLRSDEDARKDRLRDEKVEADSKAVSRSFGRSAPHKPTMHERLMPYRSR